MSCMDIAYEQLAQELARAWRGRRSQVQFSRRLGYQSNVCYPWESGRRFPRANEAMRAAVASGRNVHERLRSHLHAPLPWLEHTPIATPEGVSRLLSELRGKTQVGALASRTGDSRFAWSRWLNGRAQPRLPAFLRAIDALTVKFVDVVACLADLDELPTARAIRDRALTRRSVALAHPESALVGAALTLRGYRALPAHSDRWLAKRLGMGEDDVADILKAQAQAGLIERVGRHWAVNLRQVRPVDQPGRVSDTLRYWAERGIERIGAGQPDVQAWVIHAFDDETLEKARQLQVSHIRAMRELSNTCTVGDHLMVLNLHLFQADRAAGGPPDADE